MTGWRFPAATLAVALIGIALGWPMTGPIEAMALGVASAALVWIVEVLDDRYGG